MGSEMCIRDRVKKVSKNSVSQRKKGIKINSRYKTKLLAAKSPAETVKIGIIIRKGKDVTVNVVNRILKATAFKHEGILMVITLEPGGDRSRKRKTKKNIS